MGCREFHLDPQDYVSHSVVSDSLDYSPPGSSVHDFSRQEYWTELPLPSLEDLPDPGIKPCGLSCLLKPSLS